MAKHESNFLIISSLVNTQKSEVRIIFTASDDGGNDNKFGLLRNKGKQSYVEFKLPTSF